MTKDAYKAQFRFFRLTFRDRSLVTFARGIAEPPDPAPPLDVAACARRQAAACKQRGMQYTHHIATWHVAMVRAKRERLHRQVVYPPP